MGEEEHFSSLVAKATAYRSKADAAGDNSNLKAALESVAREYMRRARLQKPELPRMAGIE